MPLILLDIAQVDKTFPLSLGYQRRLFFNPVNRYPNWILLPRQGSIISPYLADSSSVNRAQTPLSRDHEIYQDEENIGRQFQTDTGFIDIPAVSKDHEKLLVIELKKGNASDEATGRFERYVRFIAKDIAEDHPGFIGAIITLRMTWE